jgi:hypothetical protein
MRKGGGRMKPIELEPSPLADCSVEVLMMPAQTIALARSVDPLVSRPSVDDADWAVSRRMGLETPPVHVCGMTDGGSEPEHEAGPNLGRGAGGFGAMFQRLIVEFALF